MNEIEFNLLDEKWIRVRLPDNAVREVSLSEALLHAHEYADFAGETAAQDAAILRLLLAVPLTVFYRVNAQGEAAPLKKSDQALLRWKELWDLGHFPEVPIREYFKKWHERFWLFHPERPFWQVPEARDGTYYGAAKLNGELSESSNKIRLFPLYSGGEKSAMSYSQAARWLLNLNAYDDTSSKPKGKDLPSVGAGWLGKLGFIQAQGKNLFETLMLNLTMLKDAQSLWEENIPCWELEVPRSGERTEIAMPSALAQLLTLQSRRLLLYRENGKVTGFSLLGGDFFQIENAFAEQMTVWRERKAKKGEPLTFVPARHDPDRQFWREFPTVFCRSSNNVHVPGIVQWVSRLQDRRLRLLDPKRYICFKISSIQYGDKDFFVNDSFSDILMFQADLISEFHVAWQVRITSEVERCEKAALQIAYLALDLATAAGNTNEQAANSSPAKRQFYFQIDKSFREWLKNIEAQQDDPDEKVLEWQGKSRDIAMEMAKEMVKKAGTAAFVGRSVNKKEKNGNERSELYTAPKAFNKFCKALWNIYPENQKEGGVE